MKQLQKPLIVFDSTEDALAYLEKNLGKDLASIEKQPDEQKTERVLVDSYAYSTFLAMADTQDYLHEGLGPRIGQVIKLGGFPADLCNFLESFSEFIAKNSEKNERMFLEIQAYRSFK